MIKIPRKQLFNLPSLSLFLSAVILAGLFFYSFHVSPHFFHVVAAIQLIVIFYLLTLRRVLIQTQAESALKEQDFLEKINLLQADIANEHFVVEAWRKKILRYLQFKDLTEKLSMCLSLADTSKILSSEVDNFFEQKDITIILYLFDQDLNELALASSRKNKELVNIKLKKGDAIDLWVIKTLQALLIEDIRNDFRFDADKIQQDKDRKIQSLISAPLIIDNKPVGLMRIDSAKPDCFTTEDLRVLKTISDIGALAVENAQLYERIEELAVKDSLTGLYLRRYLLTRLAEEISRQFRRKKPLSLLMIDLDKFKVYNDKYGHTAGDIVLKTVALILQEAFKKPGDLICRYGGEEFVVLLSDYSKKEAQQAAEEIRKKIAKQEIILRQKRTHISVSIGISTFPDDARVKEELIHQADQAMYKAKSKGRDRVCLFS